MSVIEWMFMVYVPEEAMCSLKAYVCVPFMHLCVIKS